MIIQKAHQDAKASEFVKQFAKTIGHLAVDVLSQKYIGKSIDDVKKTFDRYSQGKVPDDVEEFSNLLKGTIQRLTDGGKNWL